jgi:DNA polymerase III alpha subunit
MSRHEPNSIEEISKIHKEMSSFNIQLLRPHILKSKLDFSVEDGNIRFGLLSIKGISDKSIERLEKFRSEYSTKFDIFEGAEQAELNVSVLCALIQAGTFEGFKQSRSKVVYEAQLWNELTTKERKHAMEMGVEYDFDLVAVITAMTKRIDEKGKPIIKESRLATIRKHSEPAKQIYDMNSKSESFANWWYENQLLGFTHGKTLRDIFIGKCPDIMSIKDTLALPDDNPAYFVASVDGNSLMKTSKAGNKYLVFDCSDETGTVNVKVFDSKHRGKESSLQTCLALNDNETPKANNIVIIEGKKKDKCIFASLFATQTNKIFTRFADLKRAQKEKTTLTTK